MGLLINCAKKTCRSDRLRNKSLNSSKLAGSPRQKILVPLPDIITCWNPLTSFNFSLSSLSSGTHLNAGYSRSLTKKSSETLSIPFKNAGSKISSGSNDDNLSYSIALKTAGVERPIDGFTMHTLVPDCKGGSIGDMISPRPVQYAVPLLKKKVMSLPKAPDHSTICNVKKLEF